MRPKARTVPHPRPRMAGTLVYLQTGARRSHKMGRQYEAARRTVALGTHVGTGWGQAASQWTLFALAQYVSVTPSVCAP